MSLQPASGSTGPDAPSSARALGINRLAAEGLDPDYLANLAAASALEPRELFEFAGIDRTTVSRRKARPHPMLADQTPLRRAHALGPEQGAGDAGGAALRQRGLRG